MTFDSASTEPTSVETQFSSAASLTTSSSSKKKKKKKVTNDASKTEGGDSTFEREKKSRKSSKKKKKDRSSDSKSKDAGEEDIPGTMTMMMQDELPPGFTSSFQTESGVPATNVEVDNGDLISPEDVKNDFFTTHGDERRAEQFDNELSMAEDGTQRNNSKKETKQSPNEPGWGDAKRRRPNWSGKTITCVAITAVILAVIIWLIIALRSSDDDNGSGTESTTPSLAPVPEPSPTPGPTPSPTPAPTPAPNIPTSPTTLAPIAPAEIGEDGRKWEYSGVTLDVPGSDNSHLFPLAMGSNTLVASAPEDGNDGSVHTFDSTTRNFDSIRLLSDASAPSFGSSVDVRSLDGVTTLIVGANAGTNDFGSAVVYTYDGSNWQRKGDILRSSDVDQELRTGEFGLAVAVSGDGEFVAVSAPSAKNGFDRNGRGAVYGFRFESSNSSWVPTSQILGGNDYYLGVSLDSTNDGLYLVMGATGYNRDSPGGVKVYRTDGSKLNVVDGGGRAFENFGTTVKWIGHSQRRFVAGGPQYNGQVESDIFRYDRGIIRAFEHNHTDDSYYQLGSDIVGDGGELIGSSLCASDSRFAFGTAYGGCFVFEFDEDEMDWVQVGGKIATSQISPVKSCALQGDGSKIAVGLSNGMVEVFDLI